MTVVTEIMDHTLRDIARPNNTSPFVTMNCLGIEDNEVNRILMNNEIGRDSNERVT